MRFLVCGDTGWQILDKDKHRYLCSGLVVAQTLHFSAVCLPLKRDIVLTVYCDFLLLCKNASIHHLFAAIAKHEWVNTDSGWVSILNTECKSTSNSVH